LRVSSTPDVIESAPVWTPDSRRLVYVADRDGHSGLHLFDVAAATDTPLTTGHRDYAPTIAPNGTSIAFLRDATQLCTVTVAGKAEHCIAQGLVAGALEADRALTWSPDSRWLAFLADGAKN